MPEFEIGDKVVVAKPTKGVDWTLVNFWDDYPENEYVTVTDITEYDWDVYYTVHVDDNSLEWGFRGMNLSRYAESGTEETKIPRVVQYSEVRVGDLIMWQHTEGGRRESVQFRVLYAEPRYVAGDEDWAHLDIDRHFEQGELTLLSRPDPVSVGDEVGISSVGEEGTIVPAGTVASDGETVVVFITESSPAFRWHDVETGEMYDDPHPGQFRVLFVPEEEK